MDTVQIVIEYVSVLDDPAFCDQLIAALVEAAADRDVIIDNRPPTKIAIDPFKDLGPRNL